MQLAAEALCWPWRAELCVGEHVGMRNAVFGLLTLPLVFPSACVSGRFMPFGTNLDVVPANAQVVTELDLLHTGRALVDQSLMTLPEETQQQIRAVDAMARAAIVRLAVRFQFVGSGYTQASGSGVIVVSPTRAPRVLSAGHVVLATGDDREVWCRTTAGVRLPAHLMTASDGSTSADHAVFSLPDSPTCTLPECAPPRVGSLCLAYGYPDQIGIDAQGRTVGGESYEDDYLAPIRLLLRVVDASPLRLEPVAGALPLGGFSGGGIFDLEGRVVGVLTGTRWEHSREGRHVLVEACSVESMPSL